MQTIKLTNKEANWLWKLLYYGRDEIFGKSSKVFDKTSAMYFASTDDRKICDRIIEKLVVKA
jgi:hypothetical protein